jgi:hypothetical protein
MAFCDEVGPLRLYARIDVLAVIAIGPAVEGAVLHRGHVVRHEIGPELVALVYHRPQRAALRLEAQAVRIAQAACEDAPAPARTIDFPNRGAIFLRLHAVLGDVAVRADADIEQRAVLARHQALGPVMIDRAAGKFEERSARLGDLGVALAIG